MFLSPLQIYERMEFATRTYGISGSLSDLQPISVQSDRLLGDLEKFPPWNFSRRKEKM